MMLKCNKDHLCNLIVHCTLLTNYPLTFDCFFQFFRDVNYLGDCQSGLKEEISEIFLQNFYFQFCNYLNVRGLFLLLGFMAGCSALHD